MGRGVKVADCTFLSTEDEKIVCFEECPFYKDEDIELLCPFKNLLLLKKVSIKDYQFDYLYEEEEAILSIPKLYKQEYD